MILGRIGSFSIAVACTVVLHAGLVFVIVKNWAPAHDTKKMVVPKYINAKLVELEAKPKPKPKPKVQDLEQKRKRAAEQKRREQQRKQAADLKRKQEADRKRKAEADKKRKQEEAKRKAEQERKQRELAQKQMEQELFDELSEEEEILDSTADEQQVASYVALIQQKIENNWSRPPSARRDMVTEVRIQLVPTGRVVSVNVVKSSGNAALDRSVEQAVKQAKEFPELRKMDSRIFEKYFRTITLKFSPQDLRL